MKGAAGAAQADAGAGKGKGKGTLVVRRQPLGERERRSWRPAMAAPRLQATSLQRRLQKEQ